MDSFGGVGGKGNECWAFCICPENREAAFSCCVSCEQVKWPLKALWSVESQGPNGGGKWGRPVNIKKYILKFYYSEMVILIFRVNYLRNLSN